MSISEERGKGLYMWGRYQRRKRFLFLSRSGFRISLGMLRFAHASFRDSAFGVKRPRCSGSRDEVTAPRAKAHEPEAIGLIGLFNKAEIRKWFLWVYRYWGFPSLGVINLMMMVQVRTNHTCPISGCR